MIVLGTGLLMNLMKRHPQARAWVLSWIAEAKAATWRRPQDVKDRYGTASILDRDTIIFNVKGNSFRLEVRINYPVRIVRIVWCGTHAEYDRRN
jgi:mRNA interferase HigB